MRAPTTRSTTSRVDARIWHAKGAADPSPHDRPGGESADDRMRPRREDSTIERLRYSETCARPLTCSSSLTWLSFSGHRTRSSSYRPPSIWATQGGDSRDHRDHQEDADRARPPSASSPQSSPLPPAEATAKAITAMRVRRRPRLRPRSRRERVGRAEPGRLHDHDRQPLLADEPGEQVGLQREGYHGG